MLKLSTKVQALWAGVVGVSPFCNVLENDDDFFFCRRKLNCLFKRFVVGFLSAFWGSKYLLLTSLGFAFGVE